MAWGDVLNCSLNDYRRYPQDEHDAGFHDVYANGDDDESAEYFSSLNDDDFEDHL
jgi:hypothetical protein